tara:strand:- start:34554 stop:35876 length:1323 start_codon:yes stop_codon:yes gene_type:complete
VNNLADTFFEFNKIKITKAKGIYLYSSKKKYTDLTGGITGHAILGWGNQNIINGISKQAKKYCHIDYKFFDDQNRTDLSKLLLKNKFNNLNKVFLTGASGAEACEAAIKMSYQYFYSKGFKKKCKFISRKQSYHGCTGDALSLGDRPNLKFYDKILNKNTYKIPECNIYRHKYKNESSEEYAARSANDLENKIKLIGAENICAFVAETMSGGLIGDVPPPKNYWKKINKICKKYNIHLILDEVWCGTGVTGKSFCVDWDEVSPDFIFISKTLSAGYGALSAVVTKSNIVNQIYSKMGQIHYSNTHQGHSLSVAAALEAQKIIQNKKFLNEVQNKGIYLRKLIESELKDNPFFFNVRGRGLRNSLEYRTTNNHLFGTLLKMEMLKQNIILDAKWHRICLCFSLNISYKEINENFERILSKFKYLQNNWNKFKVKKINQKSF